MSLTRRSLLSLMGASGVAGLAACANLPERYGEALAQVTEKAEAIARRKLTKPRRKRERGTR